MIASHCPRCDEAFRVPTGQYPDDAYAECPWCREVFPISEVLEKLPPVLQVLSADGQPLAVQNQFVASVAGAGLAHSAESLAVDPSPIPDTDYDALSLYSEDVAEEDVDEDEDAYADSYAGVDEESYVGEDEDASQGWSDDDSPDFALTEPSGGDDAIAPMNVSPSPSPSPLTRIRAKKKGSPIRTLIGVALGPIVALPLAGGILMAFGRAPDLGFWPFDGSFDSRGTTQVVASQSSGTSRKITPNTTGRSLASDLTPDVSNQDDDPVADALSQISGKPNIDEDLLDTNDDLSTFADSANSNAGDARASITMPGGDDPIQITPITPDPDPIAEIAVPNEFGNGLEMPDLPGETEEPVVAPPENDPESVQSPVETASATEPTATDPDVVDASSEATKLLHELIGYEGEEKTRRPLLAKTYAAIAAVGAVAGEKDAKVDALVSEIVQSSLLTDLGAAAPQWLTYAKRTTDGILLIGSPGADGKTITLPSGAEVSVTGSVELPNAKRVLGLGRIVKSPSGQTVELVVAEALE